MKILISGFFLIFLDLQATCALKDLLATRNAIIYELKFLSESVNASANSTIAKYDDDFLKELLKEFNANTKKMLEILCNTEVDREKS